jgi:hypothetical protein
VKENLSSFTLFHSFDGALKVFADPDLKNFLPRKFERAALVLFMLSGAASL